MFCLAKPENSTQSVFNQASHLSLWMQATRGGHPNYPSTVRHCNQLSGPYWMQNLDGLIGCSFVFLVTRWRLFSGWIPPVRWMDGWRVLMLATVSLIRAGCVGKPRKPYKTLSMQCSWILAHLNVFSLWMLLGTVGIWHILLGETFFKIPMSFTLRASVLKYKGETNHSPWRSWWSLGFSWRCEAVICCWTELNSVLSVFQFECIHTYCFFFCLEACFNKLQGRYKDFLFIRSCTVQQFSCSSYNFFWGVNSAPLKSQPSIFFHCVWYIYAPGRVEH